MLVQFHISPTDIQRFSDTVHEELYAPLYEESGMQEGRSNRLLQRLARRSLEIEWMTLAPHSELVGQTLGEARIRTHTGASVVAILRGHISINNPGVEHIFQAHETIAVLGTAEQRATMQQLIDPPDPAQTLARAEAAAREHAPSSAPS
ncbi:MAG: hypothetical protein HC828_11290 [Blastochloris sp.]|nr:hypothetical protein [Blastochloris sp.]